MLLYWVLFIVSSIIFEVDGLSSVETAIRQFRKDALTAHNAKRALHGCPELQLNSTLSDYAQKHAEYLSRVMRFAPSNGPYGENIYKGPGPMIAGDEPVEEWYAEINMYLWDDPGYSSSTGSFTQLIWKSTTMLGMGVARCPLGHYYVVASYDPSGNNDNEFVENVPPLL